MTDCEPEIISGPDQSLSLGFAVAVHEVAFVLDHVRVIDWPELMLFADPEIVTVAAGVPPPPSLLVSTLPPPHETRNHKTVMEDKIRSGFFTTLLERLGKEPITAGYCRLL